MQYVSFDFFFWVLAAYFVVRSLKSGDDPRWWIGIGCAIGLGMMSKYTMVFFAAGIVLATLLTDARRFLKSKWLWCGVGISQLIFLPNFIWQLRHNFVSLDFLKTIHARDIRIGFTNYFLLGQFTFTLLAFPICGAGLYFCFFSKYGTPLSRARLDVPGSPRNLHDCKGAAILSCARVPHALRGRKRLGPGIARTVYKQIARVRFVQRYGPRLPSTYC